MLRIGRGLQRTLGAHEPHRRPGDFAPDRRCASSPMLGIAVRSAPRFGVKSFRSNGSIWSENALGPAFLPNCAVFYLLRGLFGAEHARDGALKELVVFLEAPARRGAHADLRLARHGQDTLDPALEIRPIDKVTLAQMP